MKKTVLTIAILSLAMVTVSNNNLRVVHGYTFRASELLGLDTAQRQRVDELTEEFHQTYPLSATGLVSIANINGDIHIGVWDQNEVKVDAVKSARQRERISEVTIDVVNTADSVRIKTKYPEHNLNFDRNRENNPASVAYTLTIPRKARIEGAELVNGSLDIQGVEGDVHASLVNGEVKASGLSGEVKLSTVNGSVEANVARLDGEKSISLKSVNGSIVLIVPASASAQVKANTLHGGITNDFGLDVHDGEFVGHDLNGQIGSGGPRIIISNVNGPIEIKRG
jgi:DUF4097 and DUF4098 domain-containing protein YvlB